MLDLSDCLAKRNIEPGRTLVMRHRPTSKSLREALSWWAGERPAWYNDYQRSQKPRQEKMLSSASYLVSCIGHEPGLALFVGIYRVCGFRPISEEEFWAIPANKEMRTLTQYRDRDGLVRSRIIGRNERVERETLFELAKTRTGLGSVGRPQYIFNRSYLSRKRSDPAYASLEECQRRLDSAEKFTSELGEQFEGMARDLSHS
jgi:hypothetical protein